MTSIIRSILLCLLLSLSISVKGQTSYYTHLRDIGVKEGLSHHQVNDILTDDEGTWIATEAGLDYFDGYKIRHWSKAKNGLSKDFVNQVLKDQSGNLWLFSRKEKHRPASPYSINMLDVSRDSIVSLKAKFGSDIPLQREEIDLVFTDKHQVLYFRGGQRLWKYSKDMGFEEVPLPDNFTPFMVMSSGEITGMFKKELSWIDTNGELKKISSPFFGNKILEKIKTKYDPQLFWLTYGGTHIIKVSVDARRKIIDKQDFSHFCAYDSLRNRYWMYSGNYIKLYDDTGSLLYQHPTNQIVRSLRVDQFGTLWIGSSRGLSMLRIDKKKFTQYLSEPAETTSLRDNRYTCRGILEEDGQLLVNTKQGRMKIDLSTGKTDVFDIDDAAYNISKRFFSIFKDSKNNLWFTNSHLLKWNTDKQKTSSIYPLQSSNKPGWSMYEDTNDRIWIGQNKGLFFFEEEAVQTFRAYNGFDLLAKSRILQIFEDKEQTIWLITDTGLYVLDLKEGIVERYWKEGKNNFHIPSNDIQHMHQDAAGIFWLASEDEGLIRWDKRKNLVQLFSKKDGFPSNNIYSILEDDYNYLWMSTNYGLIRFYKNDYSFQSYFETDGISDNEFNRISAYQSKDGHIYFGSQNGVTAFHPKDFLSETSDSSNPQLQISDYHFILEDGSELSNQSISVHSDQLLTLPPNVRFASLQIKYPDLFWTDQFKLEYQLRDKNTEATATQIEGVYVSPDNVVRLLGTVPGDYELNIQAKSAQGVHMTKSLQIPIVVSHPFYQETWFRILSVAIIIFVFSGILKWRTLHLRKRENELKLLVKEGSQQLLKDRQLIEKQEHQIHSMQMKLEEKDRQWLNEFEQIIQSKLSDMNLDLAEIIDNMGTSRSTFYEKVKILTNMTPNQYLQEARLQKALQLLEGHECDSVKEVAYSVGIKKPGYFSKLFKERFATLPSEYL